MLYRNSSYPLKRLQFVYWAFLAAIAILPNHLFGQSLGDFSNQGALDLNTPLRFKPVVGLEMGGIWLSRRAPDSQDIVLDGTGNVLLNAQDLQGRMGAGLDTTLSLFNLFSDHNAVDVQMRFFQASDITANQTISATEVLPLFFQGIPANVVNSFDIFYDSQIRSFEANLVARTPYQMRLLAGFRFFEVDEKLG